MQRVALFDFSTRNEQELGFGKGEVINVVSTFSEVGDGWWIGKKTTEAGTLIGVFPANYTADSATLAQDKLYSPKVTSAFHTKCTNYFHHIRYPGTFIKCRRRLVC